MNCRCTCTALHESVYWYSFSKAVCPSLSCCLLLASVHRVRSMSLLSMLMQRSHEHT